MKYLICGNGGLAAEASHFAAELTGKYYKDIYIPCIDLGSNEAQLTALTNDIGWENVYAHLVEVFGGEGDVLIGMTTSKAKNILYACEVAQRNGLKVILLDRDTLEGNDTGEKQEYAVKYLHKLAREIKDERPDSSYPYQRRFYPRFRSNPFPYP